jgi:hypothetical protein
MPHQASVVVSESRKASSARRRFLRIDEQLDQRKAGERLLLLAQGHPALLARVGEAAALIGALPRLRFRNARADPQHEQGRQHAEHEHDAPGARTERANEEPDQRGQEKSDSEAALHQAGALAAGVVRPHLGGDRGPGRPFRADRDADQETQERKRHPVPRKRAQSGDQRIGQDGIDHRPAAADIVGQDTAQNAADAPTKQRDRDDGPGIGRDLRELRGIEQLAQRHPDREDQGESLIAVEHPAQIGGSERLPLDAGERNVPGTVRGGGDGLHVDPPSCA